MYLDSTEMILQEVILESIGCVVFPNSKALSSILLNNSL